MTSAPAPLADRLRTHPTVRIGDDIEPAWREPLVAWAGTRGLRVDHPDATLAITTQPGQAVDARWVHSPFAGVEHLVPAVPDDVLLTRTTGTMPRRIAEYVLTWVLAERWQAARYLADSATGTWDPTGPPAAPTRGDAVVVGTGTVGAAIARTLAGVGLRVVGLSRSGRSDEAFDAVLPLADVHDMSVFAGARADVLVLALPHTAQTIGVIDSELLRAFEGVHLINIGRGSAIGTSTLLDALETGRVRHATLDVTEQEPLGPSSLLWRRRDVTITPHISGRTLPSDVVASLDAALTQVRAGTRPASAVMRERGY
jgi:glyoxylate/hydroxypyruvate reductase A